jgi:hypothetical protein
MIQASGEVIQTGKCSPNGKVHYNRPPSIVQYRSVTLNQVQFDSFSFGQSSLP